jgi:hypothetical protein
MLKYDTNLGGYVTGVTESQLRGAPKHSESSWNLVSPSTARSVDDYYGRHSGSLSRWRSGRSKRHETLGFSVSLLKP